MTKKKDAFAEILTETRRQNLRLWFEHRTTPEKDRSLISQLKSGNGKQAFGERVARRLERENGMPTYYLDNPNNNGVVISGQNNINNSNISNNVSYDGAQSALARHKPDDEHHYRIDYIDVRAAAGMTGFVNSDYPEIISQIYLSEDGLRDLVGRKNTNGICLISVPTDSMEPTIQKGDIVLIDMNINHYDGEGIYAFAIDDELYIKRLQKIPGEGIIAISDNKERYKAFPISEKVYTSANFVGKFIRRWRIDVKDL